MHTLRFVTTVTATPGQVNLVFDPFFAPPDNQYVYPAGFLTVEWGDFTTTQTGEFPVDPTPWQSSAFGQPTIYNLSQFIAPINFGALTQWGEHTVFIPEDQFIGAAGINGTQWGTHLVAWYLRWLDHAGRGYSGPTMGNASVVHKLRYVYPAWAVFSQYGTPMVGRNVTLEMQGWSSSGMGQPGVRLGNLLEPAGWRSGSAVPTPWVSRSPRVIGHVQGAASTEWGNTYAWRLLQNVTHSGFPWEAQGTQFGDFNHVFNRNRTVSATGYSAARFPNTHAIFNTGRALLPFELVGTRWGGDTFIAYRIRTLTLNGFDAFVTSSFGTQVFNAARLISAQGWQSSMVGVPEWVESNLQTVRHHSGSLPVFGQAFISHRVRTVTQYGWLTPSHRMGAPRVWFNRISPLGLPPAGVGDPVLIGPFKRTITPRWLLQDRYGYPTVRNLTPQVYPLGRPYTEFGQLSWVSFRVRDVLCDGVWVGTFGNASIADRTRRPLMSGWSSFSMSPWGHSVRNVDPDPPSLRTISVRWFQTTDSNWRNYAAQFIGQPTVAANNLWPEGLISLTFGETTLRLQGANIVNRYSHLEWGFHRVELAARPVGPEGIVPATEAGRPRLSPFTIWAPIGAPLQAITNHPAAGQPHRIGELEPEGYDESRWPWWGHTFIAYKLRTITTFHGTGENPSQAAGKTRFGDTTIQLRSRRLLLNDLGINSLVMGRPILIPHSRKVWPVGLNATQFGVHRIALGDTRQYITGAGAQERTQWGEPFLWGGTRFVFAHGSSHTVWGNNFPMVHYPRRFEISGGDLFRGGEPWVSFKNRVVQIEGTDMFEADWTSFYDRMRVASENSGVVAGGLVGTQFGRHNVVSTRQIIAPYMIPSPRCMSINTLVAHG